MTEVKAGTRWRCSNNKLFVVLDVVELEGHTWVHYRNEDNKEPSQYSCYQESFVARFHPFVNARYF